MPIIAGTFRASSSSAFWKLAAAPAVSPPISCWPPRLAKKSALRLGGAPLGASSPYGSFGLSVSPGVLGRAGVGDDATPPWLPAKLGGRRVGSAGAGSLGSAARCAGARVSDARASAARASATWRAGRADRGAGGADRGAGDAGRGPRGGPAARAASAGLAPSLGAGAGTGRRSEPVGSLLATICDGGGSAGALGAGAGAAIGGAVGATTAGWPDEPP